MINIKNGSMEDFFDSAIETAKEIDNGKKVTSEHTIWMETTDLLNILKPQRTETINTIPNS